MSTDITLIAVLTKAVGFQCCCCCSSTAPRRIIKLVQTQHQRAKQPSLEGVGAPKAPLELKLRLSESQPLFYTSCQRVTHEYVCRGGRSHNLCKVSSCIMQLIYASPGRDGSMHRSACTHKHTRTHT